MGIDPGSQFEGFSVVGGKDTVLNLMAEAPDHVKDAVVVRRTMRRARRSRKWRRPKRFDNRLNRRAYSPLDQESVGSESSHRSTPEKGPPSDRCRGGRCSGGGARGQAPEVERLLQPGPGWQGPPIPDGASDGPNRAYPRRLADQSPA